MAGFKFSFKEKNISKEAFKELKDLNKKVIRVGVLGSQGSRSDTKLNNASIGSIMEFGSNTKNIPARSFLRMPLELHKKDIKDFIFQALRSKEKPLNKLKRIGIFCESIVQKAFASGGFGQWAPLKESTIKAKGSTSILIKYGFLRKSVSSDVVNK